jgi:hypothetical protein
MACDAPAGTVADATDCDDTDGDVNPGAFEACNGIDDNCDGAIDEDGATDVLTWYADTDGDGFGDAASSVVDCEQPADHVSDDSDCDDSAGAVNPDATESGALAALAASRGATPSAMLRQLLAEGLERRSLWPPSGREAARVG